MAYSTDKTKGTCINSGRCTAKPVPELFHAFIRPTSQIYKKAVNNAVQWHSQAQTSYPAQRPVPYGAEFQPWRCRGVANVFAKPQNAEFAGLACFLRYFNHFCKSSVKTKNYELSLPSVSSMPPVVKHKFEQTNPIFYFAKNITLYSATVY